MLLEEDDCNNPHRNIRHAFKVILKEEGGFWSGCLYRGWIPTVTV
jgi:hypothetical protein